MAASKRQTVTETWEHGNAPLIESETRFAVVMYGGISLAIYIHGVAQELYHMVRATARVPGDPTRYLCPVVTGTEKVYRELGAELKTKFVVDILSGTSAGGINAIFLAKALVNACPMEFVKQFWADQGDIASLVNDQGSMKGLRGIRRGGETLGLLNSQRFYYKLLEALKQMESAPEDFISPYVSELDLNITATDIRGLNLSLRVSNSNTVVEPRFRNVFQFVYRPQLGLDGRGGAGTDRYRNDFSRGVDPFLAFAARCTASIPPAFEAMQLNDIAPILNSPEFREYGTDILTDGWKRFYKDYLEEGNDFAFRAFGDGGYLDNKPFSYATDALLRRSADVPVNRLLVYIEPSPENPEDKPESNERPDMLQNVLSALLVLPRNETIRDDLERIEKRNEIIRRVKETLSNVSYEIPPRETQTAKQQRIWKSSQEWASSYYLGGKKENDALIQYGAGYVGYHQLMVESVLSSLSNMYVRGIGRREGGKEEGEIKDFLHKWLEKYYSVRGGGGKTSQNNILYRLDVSFRMRRIQFLQGILNEFIREIKDYLQNGGKNNRLASAMEKILSASNVTLKFLVEFRRDEKAVDDATEDAIWLLQSLKQKLNQTYSYLKYRANLLREFGLAAVDESGLEDRDLAAYRNKLAKLKEWFDIKENITRSIEKLAVKKPEKRDLMEQASALLLDGDAAGRLKDLILKTSMEKKTREQLIRLLAELSKADPIRLMEDLSVVLASHPKKGEQQSGYLYKTLEKAREDDEAHGIRQEPTGREGKRADGIKKALAGIPSQKRLDEKRIKVYGEFHQQIQKCLAFYYRNFDYYDMLTFPITYGTDAAEADEVEIVRVSPEEATEIVDERETKKKKLAGTALANFGAFFKRDWRVKDILWGRLDGAEILISQVMRQQEKKKAKDFVLRALGEILEEDYKPIQNKRMEKWLAWVERFWGRTLPDEENAKTLKTLLSSSKVEEKQALAHFRKNYETDMEFPPETLDSVTRAVTVTGNLLHDLFGKYPSSLANWQGRVKSLSLWITGLLFLARESLVTNSMIGALYLGSALLVVSWILFSDLWKPGLIGAIAFLLTASIHVGVVRVRVFFRGRGEWHEKTLMFFERMRLKFLVPLVEFVLAFGLVILLLLLVILGLEALGMPRMGGAVGEWIESLEKSLSPLMEKIVALFKAK